MRTGCDKATNGGGLVVRLAAAIGIGEHDAWSAVASYDVGPLWASAIMSKGVLCGIATIQHTSLSHAASTILRLKF